MRSGEDEGRTYAQDLLLADTGQLIVINIVATRTGFGTRLDSDVGGLGLHVGLGSSHVAHLVAGGIALSLGHCKELCWVSAEEGLVAKKEREVSGCEGKKEEELQSLIYHEGNESG